MKGFELSIIIILLAVVVAILSLILSKVKESIKFIMTTIIYLVVTALFIGITSLSCFIGLRDHAVSIFILIQVLILIIGILHAYFVYKLVPWTLKDRFLWEFLFAFATAGLGAVFFLFIYYFLLREHSLQYILLTACTWFFVPFLYLQAFNRYIAIPARVYRKWHYPVGKDIADPLDSEMVSLLVISFVFHKKMNATDSSTFRAKAPAHMVFGRLFYYFINNYNERHREEPIEYIDQDNFPHGWVFYHKPNWLGIKRYIDPDQIIIDNHINENSIIICQRFKNS